MYLKEQNIFSFFKYLLFKKIVYLLETDRHQFAVPLIYVFNYWFLYVPWLGIEPTTLEYQDDALINWITWLGPRIFFLCIHFRSGPSCLFYYLSVVGILILIWKDFFWFCNLWIEYVQTFVFFSGCKKDVSGLMTSLVIQRRKTTQELFSCAWNVRKLPALLNITVA